MQTMQYRGTSTHTTYKDLSNGRPKQLPDGRILLGDGLNYSKDARILIGDGNLSYSKRDMEDQIKRVFPRDRDAGLVQKLVSSKKEAKPFHFDDPNNMCGAKGHPVAHVVAYGTRTRTATPMVLCMKEVPEGISEDILERLRLSVVENAWGQFANSEEDKRSMNRLVEEVVERPSKFKELMVAIYEIGQRNKMKMTVGLVGMIAISLVVASGGRYQDAPIRKAKAAWGMLIASANDLRGKATSLFTAPQRWIGRVGEVEAEKAAKLLADKLEAEKAAKVLADKLEAEKKWSRKKQLMEILAGGGAVGLVHQRIKEKAEEDNKAERAELKQKLTESKIQSDTLLTDKNEQLAALEKVLHQSEETAKMWREKWNKKFKQVKNLEALAARAQQHISEAREIVDLDATQAQT